MAGGVAERPAGDGADVLLELRTDAGVHGPMAGIVDPRRDLVDEEARPESESRHEHLDREDADMVERFGDPGGDCDRLGGQALGAIAAGTLEAARMPPSWTFSATS